MLVIVFLYVIVSFFTRVLFHFTFFYVYAWKCSLSCGIEINKLLLVSAFCPFCCYSIVSVVSLSLAAQFNINYDCYFQMDAWTLLLYRVLINELERYKIFIDSIIVRPQVMFSMLVYSAFAANDEWRTTWGLYWHGPRTGYLNKISRCVC